MENELKVTRRRVTDADRLKEAEEAVVKAEANLEKKQAALAAVRAEIKAKREALDQLLKP